MDLWSLDITFGEILKPGDPNSVQTDQLNTTLKEHILRKQASWTPPSRNTFFNGGFRKNWKYMVVEPLGLPCNPGSTRE